MINTIYKIIIIILAFMLMLSCGKEKHDILGTTFNYKSEYYSDFNLFAQHENGFSHFESFGKYDLIQEEYQDYLKAMKGESAFSFDFIRVINKETLQVAVTDENGVQSITDVPYEQNGARLIIDGSELEFEFDEDNGWITICLQGYILIGDLLDIDFSTSCKNKVTNNKVKDMIEFYESKPGDTLALSFIQYKYEE